MLLDHLNNYSKRISDHLSGGHNVIDEYITKKKFNPVQFGLFVFTSYFGCLMFYAVIQFIYHCLRFKPTLYFTIPLLVVSIIPVAIAMWIEQLRFNFTFLTKWALNIVYSVAFVYAYFLFKHITGTIVWLTLIIVIITISCVGLIKLNYEDKRVRMKLFLFNTPFSLYFLFGAPAVLIMFCFKWMSF